MWITNNIRRFFFWLAICTAICTAPPDPNDIQIETRYDIKIMKERKDTYVWKWRWSWMNCIAEPTNNRQDVNDAARSRERVECHLWSHTFRTPSVSSSRLLFFHFLNFYFSFYGLRGAVKFFSVNCGILSQKTWPPKKSANFGIPKPGGWGV